MHCIKEISVDRVYEEINSILNKANRCTKESYDATAQEYKKAVSDCPMPKVHAEHFLSMLPPHPQILDVGCGSGRDAKLFATRGAQVVGIDFSPNMIRIAEQEVPSAEFHVMDMENISFSPDFFDGIWASASLLHLPKFRLPQLLQKFHQLLKPEGIFYLSLKQGQGEGVEQDKRYGNVEKFWSYFDEDEICSLIKKARFSLLKKEIIERQSSYQTHPFLYLFCKK